MILAGKVKKWTALLAATATVGCVWLVLLPAYARRPAMSEHLQWLDDQGIDPSAMYYTELEVMDEILARERSKQLAKEFHRDH